MPPLCFLSFINQILLLWMVWCLGKTTALTAGEISFLNAFKESTNVASQYGWSGSNENACNETSVWEGLTCNGSSIIGLYFLDSLSGNIPLEIGNLSLIQFIILNHTELTGQIPAEIGKLSFLSWLELSSNSFTGQIPFTLGDIQSLQFLFLDHNQLNGSVPQELGGLPNLVQVHLEFNNLVGELPYFQSTHLKYCDVDGNQVCYANSLPSNKRCQLIESCNNPTTVSPVKTGPCLNCYYSVGASDVSTSGSAVTFIVVITFLLVIVSFIIIGVWLVYKKSRALSVAVDLPENNDKGSSYAMAMKPYEYKGGQKN